MAEGREIPEHEYVGMSSEPPPPQRPQSLHPDKDDKARLDGKTIRKDGHTSVALV